MESSRDKLKVLPVIAHVDMDCFYCAVERGLDPSLNGVAMAVAQYNTFGDLSTLRPSDNRRVKSNGSLIAVSYEARAAGVKRTMRGAEAIKACPGLVLVQVPVCYGKADIAMYRDAGDRVVQVLSRRYKCVVEKASVDEVYLDVTEEASRLLARCFPPNLTSSSSSTEVTDSPLDFCKDILGRTRVLLGGEDLQELKMDKRHISKGHENTGFPLSSSPVDADRSVALDNTPATAATTWRTRPATVWGLPENRNDCLLVCGAYLVQQLRLDLLTETGYTSSAGLAHTKSLAKVASAMHKPNKMTAVPSSIVPALMQSLPINRLKGFGGKLGEELQEEFGIITAGDLLEVGERRLAARYGDRVGWMVAMARGEVSEPVKPVVAAQIISCGKTFRGKMVLPFSALSDGRVLHWLGEMAKELVGRLADMAAKHGMHPACIGTHAGLSLQARPYSASSSSSVNATKSCAISPKVRLPGGGYDASSLALQAMGMVKAMVENSPKLQPHLSGPDRTQWSFTTLFLNATGFTKRASEKQSISAFFKSSSLGNKVKPSSPSQESESLTTPQKRTLSESAGADAGVSTGGTPKCVRNDSSLDSVTPLSVEPKRFTDHARATDVSPALSDKKSDIIRHKSCDSSVVVVDEEEGSAVKVSPETVEWSTDTDAATKNSCSGSGSYSSVGDSSYSSSCRDDCGSGSGSGSGGSSKPSSRVLDSPCGSTRRVQIATDTDMTTASTGNVSIDMEVFQQLPSDIQRELAAAYNLQEETNVDEPTDVASPPMSNHSSAAMRVSREVTVDSIISRRVKAKERKQRESSGMHLYFQKK